MLGNRGTETQNAQSGFTNALTTAAGLLVTPLNKTTEAMTALTDAFNKGTAILLKAIETPSNGMQWDWPGATGGGGGLPGLPDTGGNTGSGLFIPTAFRTRGGGRGGGMSGGGQSLSSDAIRGRAQQAMAFFQSKGWSPEAAAAITARLIRESGLDEKAVGDGGAAQGALQWHADRFADVAAGIHMDPRSSLTAALEAVNWELLHGHDAGMRDAGRYMRGNHTAAEDGSYFSARGVRPYDPYGVEAAQTGVLAGDVLRMPPGAGGPVVKGQIAPLKVVHMTKDGRVIRTEQLPVTMTPQPRSWNA